MPEHHLLGASLNAERIPWERFTRPAWQQGEDVIFALHSKTPVSYALASVPVWAEAAAVAGAAAVPLAVAEVAAVGEEAAAVVVAAVAAAEAAVEPSPSAQARLQRFVPERRMNRPDRQTPYRHATGCARDRRHDSAPVPRALPAGA